jgi:hypothetical protein
MNIKSLYFEVGQLIMQTVFTYNHTDRQIIKLDTSQCWDKHKIFMSFNVNKNWLIKEGTQYTGKISIFKVSFSLAISIQKREVFNHSRSFEYKKCVHVCVCARARACVHMCGGGGIPIFRW